MDPQQAEPAAPPALVLDDMTVRLPIIQGGMGVGISLSGLAAAVADEGGIGVISAAGIGINDPDFEEHPLESHLRELAKEIRNAGERSDGVIGVNIMVAMSDYEKYVSTAVDAEVDIIFSGAGLPMKLPEMVSEDCGVKLAPIVSSSRAAKLLCRHWKKQYDRLPDLIVVEGPLAGGHLGFKIEELEDDGFLLEKLVRATIESVSAFSRPDGRPIPVIAAGGIYTGADMRAFLEMGASGVQMGTRFVITEECDASLAFKQAYLDCGPDDLMIIKSPVGLPGRAIRNRYLDSMMRGEEHPVKCPLRCIQTCPGTRAPFCIAAALVSAKNGDLDHGFAFAGANAWRADTILTVHELMQTLLEEYQPETAPGGSV